MAAVQPLTRASVLAAIKEFDRLGREPFLSKYDFRKATTYFLRHNGRSYDAKPLVGAAHSYVSSRRRALSWSDFGSRESTTKKWLEELRFRVVTRKEAEERAEALASERLDIGNLYTREMLKRILSTADATINTGVFRPKGYRSVLLFVTEEKTRDRTQFEDHLQGDVLHWQGQLSGRTDETISDHRASGLEILLFYRRKKYEYEKAAFKYEGRFECERRRGSHPASFILKRLSKLDPVGRVELTLAASEQSTFNPRNDTDARVRIQRAIFRRRGQPKFRASLLRASSKRCAITGCDCVEVLEAAHIRPYKGDHTNHVTNGLLLRADLHTLFDLGWIAIDHRTRRVYVHPVLTSTEYKKIHGRRIAWPRDPSDRPNEQALKRHMESSRVGKMRDYIWPAGLRR